MGGRTLLGSLSFAAVAALGAIPWLLVFAPYVGRTVAVVAYGSAAVVLYVVWIAPSWPRGFALGALTALLAFLALLAGFVASSSAVTFLLAAVGLAIVRSGFLYRGKPARALVIEGILILGGLLFAHLLDGTSLLNLGLAIWGFFLIQSLYFVIGGIGERPAEEPAGDAFERAREKALTLMDEPVG